MPDLSDLVPNQSGQVENFYLLGQVQIIKLIKFCISYFDLSYYDFTCCIEYSVNPDQLSSSNLQKPADLDIQCC